MIVCSLLFIWDVRSTWCNLILHRSIGEKTDLRLSWHNQITRLLCLVSLLCLEWKAHCLPHIICNSPLFCVYSSHSNQVPLLNTCICSSITRCRCLELKTCSGKVLIPSCTQAFSVKRWVCRMEINVIFMLCTMRIGLQKMAFLGSLTSVYINICTDS